MLGTIWIDTAVLLGGLHLVITASVRYTMRFAAHCHPLKLDLHELPDEVASVFRPRVPEFASLGFECTGFYDCGRLINETHSYLAQFCNRETNDIASVTTLVTPAKCASYLEFSTTFESGTVLDTNTNASLPLTPSNPEHRVFRFPKLQAAKNLYRTHRQLIEKYAAGTWPQAEAHDDGIEQYVRTIENYGPRHERIGHMKLAADGESYQLTWKGAFLMTWRAFWPNSVIRRLRQRHLMQSELQSLEIRGLTALQKA